MRKPQEDRISVSTPVALPDILLEVQVGVFRIREIRYPPGFLQEPHSHEQVGVTLVFAGSLRETALRTEETASPLSVVVKPAGLVHEIEVGPRGAATLQVQVLTDARELLEEAPGGLGAWRWQHAGAGGRELVALLKALREAGQATDLEALEDGILDLLGAVCDPMEQRPAGKKPPAWLSRVRARLEEQIATSPRVRDLAADAGVHPVSLTRAFRRQYGVSISRYRSRFRLHRAADALQNTRREISRIAYDAGYADHAHLCRDLRAAMGVSPSELRGLAPQGDCGR